MRKLALYIAGSKPVPEVAQKEPVRFCEARPFRTSLHPFLPSCVEILPLFAMWRTPVKTQDSSHVSEQFLQQTPRNNGFLSVLHSGIEAFPQVVVPSVKAYATVHIPLWSLLRSEAEFPKP